MEQNFKFGNLTDIGLVRQANEDYYGCFDTVNGFVFVVCDGMGGHVGGAVASQTAVEAIRVFYDTAQRENIIISMQNALSYANNAILNKVVETPELDGMGTTAVLVIVRNDKVYYAHVGDSRIYYVHKKKLYRITRDHSIVQSLVDDGHITEKEAEKHPKRNQITKALGIQQNIEATICNEPLMPVAGDCFFLCSDGLTGMVPDNFIIKIINNDKKNLQEKVADLVTLAKHNGGTDNITAQMIQFETTANSQSNFKIPAETLVKNKTISKAKGKQKTWLFILGSVLILTFLYLGYSYYYKRHDGFLTVHSKDKKDSVAESSATLVKTEGSDVKLSEKEAEKEANKFDNDGISTENKNEQLIVAKNPNFSSSDTTYEYIIKAGDNDKEMGIKFKTTWPKLKKNANYKDASPKKGDTIRIKVKRVFPGTSDIERENNIKNATSEYNIKESELIILNGTFDVLVPKKG